MEEIMVFLNEKLPEIITIIFVVGYIYQFFIKADVKKQYKLS